MAKKILLGLVAIAVVVGGVAGMSAYEAHVINVTAHIENALSVTPDELMFGTVFPQEKFYKDLTVALSGSFLEEDRVDDVEYVIKQKPKPYNPEDHEYCLTEWEEAMDGFMDCFMSCLVRGGSEEFCWHGCKSIVFNYADPERCYPPLCLWLSKIPDGTPPNDIELYPFHGPEEVAYGTKKLKGHSKLSREDFLKVSQAECRSSRGDSKDIGGGGE